MPIAAAASTKSPARQPQRHEFSPIPGVRLVHPPSVQRGRTTASVSAFTPAVASQAQLCRSGRADALTSGAPNSVKT
jgi:hypothetical protein